MEASGLDAFTSFNYLRGSYEEPSVSVFIATLLTPEVTGLLSGPLSLHCSCSTLRADQLLICHVGRSNRHHAAPLDGPPGFFPHALFGSSARPINLTRFIILNSIERRYLALTEPSTLLVLNYFTSHLAVMNAFLSVFRVHRGTTQEVIFTIEFHVFTH